MIKLIQKISKEMNPNSSIYDSIDETKSKYYTYRQRPEDSNETHTKTFKSLVEHVEHSGEYLYKDKVLVEHEKALEVKAEVNVSNKTDDGYYPIIKEKAMGAALIKRSDQGRYRVLLTDIRDQHGYGSDVYPKKSAAHNMLEDFARSRNLVPRKKSKFPRRSAYGGKNGDKNEIKGMMYNLESFVPGTNGRIFKTIQYCGCRNWGHYVAQCPERVD